MQPDRTTQDITELQERLAAIIEGSDDAIVSKDLNGIVTSWNRAAERIFGYTAGEMIGRPIALLVPPERPDEEPEILARIRRGERVDHFQTVRVTRDGRRIDVSVTISPIRNAAGEIVGASKIGRDISVQKRLEAELETRSEQIQSQNEELAAQNEELAAQNEELAAQNEELAQADRQRNDFLAMLAHELRNPLAPILNAVHLLGAAGAADPQLRRPAEIIGRQIRHMSHLLDGLLDVSRVTRGMVVLQQETIDLAVVVCRAVQDLEDYVEERGHELSVEVPGPPVPVVGDPVRLAQVVTNLVNNAAKFTERGGKIGVAVRAEGAEAVLRVRDNGIGIERELLPRVFDLFRQADQGLDRSEGGLGIGLTIVRDLVAIHNGSIAAHSEGLGRGTEFTIRLPLAPGDTFRSEAPLRPGAAAASRPCGRMLIVDDNRDAATTLADVAALWGCEVRTAFDGPAALHAAAEEPPDVVVLDLGMPGMDGYEVARRLRAMGGFESVVLVAVSGYGSDAAREQAREAGFDYHLLKPVEPEELRSLLRIGAPE